MMKNPGTVLVFKPNTKREEGRKTQLSNIQASRAVSEIVKTTLGPMAMLKMMLDPLGGIVITNDGNCILREVDVAHPAAKSLIELSRSQDEEVGDGTTSVVILSGELLSIAESFLKDKIHPTIIVNCYMTALNLSLKYLEEIAIEVDVNNEENLLKAIDSCLSTKFVNRYNKIVSKLSLEATQCVKVENVIGKKEIDIKRYAKVEKIPGGDIMDSYVLKGVMINKDITHPKMRRYIKNPRILLLDCTLEYKKAESQTNVEILDEHTWNQLLLQEEIEVKKLCEYIIDSRCDIVITEKGVSDLAQHFLVKKNISVIRRVRKTDLNRLERITGATIVNRCDEIVEKDIGTKCGLFEIKKIGDDYYSFFVECENPRACTILLRGATKDVLNEVERNLHDGMNVAKNIMLEGKLLYGGGCTEMRVSQHLIKQAANFDDSRKSIIESVASAFEIIPKILAQNSGVNVVKCINELRTKHEKPESEKLGIDGVTGEIIDVSSKNIWDLLSVKKQIYKSAIEAASMILRIDDVVSGIGKDDKIQKPIKNEFE
ncbi:T-complex protein 1 subunit gamma, putative [Plasmodium chabaudi chabaudi]|uniref:T-complex protein 1 subunit gamma n=2 Tax=Plasmodium chabaudi TaxID=5825 RepID=A0A4V0KE38_PLACU|nr:T-complex protein 1 subunit gamma, putative [Plasmodium chabaudi chabaudi]SCM25411.1 T-complex protein 1 subunit gamma, putative [Plasmodium chabaudi adami]VTZ71138.1 T-complex protein 1 subunit gamma, putative [Plasmodium chabaudi chabaudi]|eukprot:XP_745923.2 t-complex protein 1 gamma subunit, putative [Plasmodium chabaudi chabaudi]